MKKLLTLLLTFSLLLGMNGCTASGFSASSKQSISYFDLFDTYCSFTAYGLSEARFDEVSLGLHALLERFHQESDIYHEYEEANLATLNRLAGHESVLLNDELADFLDWCLEAYTLSQGRVNLCLGAVTRLWHEARETKSLPDQEALQDASLHCSPKLLYRGGNCFYLSDPEASVDVGALAKGYAGRLAKEYLSAQGVENYLLNLGGSLVASGRPMGSGRTDFTIGIQSPDRDEGVYADTFHLKNRCAATSGDYQRYFEIDGVRYHHIIDPQTLFPSAYQRSVTVLADDPALCDLLSTALFLMNESDGRALCERLGADVIYVK